MKKKLLKDNMYYILKISAKILKIILRRASFPVFLTMYSISLLYYRITQYKSSKSNYHQSTTRKI